MYYQMFAKNGQLEFEEETLGLEPVEDEQAQECDEEETEDAVGGDARAALQLLPAAQRRPRRAARRLALPLVGRRGHARRRRLMCAHS